MLFDKQRLQENNIMEYICTKYNVRNPKEMRTVYIKGIIPLLQNDYGERNDCTLTSILTVADFFKKPISLSDEYKKIEKIATKFFYNGNFGTLPFFIRSIMKRVCPDKKAKSAYIKNIGFNQYDIAYQLDENNPVILSVFNDGRNFYKNHSITIVGYKSYLVSCGNAVHLFMVYDNWSKTISYVDYNALSAISSINYYE